MRKLTKNVSNSKFKAFSMLIVPLILIVLLAYPLFSRLNFGLDLQGGFEVLYEVKTTDGGIPTDTVMNTTYNIIQDRIDILGVSEPEISIEGGNRIRIKLAGVTDPETARALLSTTANLSFRDINDNLLMDSSVLSAHGASLSTDSKGKPSVALNISDIETFGAKTGQISKYEDGSNLMVIWLDFKEGENSYDKEENCGDLTTSTCLSAATVEQAFYDSEVSITSDSFTNDTASQLVELINSGALQVDLEEISSRTVAASFGEDTLNKTIIASAIGILLVILIMTVIYQFAGFVAGMTVLIYGLLVFSIFWLIGGVLTLPGIAAAIIGIGMAVDANVISFERIKEELKKKKSLKEAFTSGNKNSVTTILDANATTFLVALILFIFGESSVKGFATMFMINIVVTLFVMVVVNRSLLKAFVMSGMFDKKVDKFIGYKETDKKPFGHGFDFVKNRVKFLITSASIIIIGLIVVIIAGFNLGVDYLGGSSITIKTSDDIVLEEIETVITGYEYEIVDSSLIDGDNGAYIQIVDVLTTEQIKQVNTYFEDNYNAKVDVSVISTIVKEELTMNAIYAVLLASLGIVIYIAVRFRSTYSIAAIIALAHDVLIVVAVFSIFRFEVASMVIAALLAIIGYSINDTIVSFDRIRENIGKKGGTVTTKKQLTDIVNTSLHQTLLRSIFTTITTLIPVLCLMIFGAYDIFNFNIALLIGLIAGTYSSIFIASQVWLEIESRKLLKEEKEPKEKKKKKVIKDDLDEIEIPGLND